jgi:hypothetical protein
VVSHQSPPQTATFSDRLGVLCILLVVLGLNVVDRYRVAPPWLGEATFALLAVCVAVATITKSPFWHRVQMYVIWGTVLLGLVLNSWNLANVVNKLAFHSVAASTLFYTAATIWLNNMLCFTLLYWLIDGGGPGARRAGGSLPDFDFPASNATDKVRKDWQPQLVDYLFLGFTTATAFSPTEALPLTPRAKLLMMFESAISLITVAVVAARAINIIQ